MTESVPLAIDSPVQPARLLDRSPLRSGDRCQGAFASQQTGVQADPDYEGTIWHFDIAILDCDLSRFCEQSWAGRTGCPDVTHEERSRLCPDVERITCTIHGGERRIAEGRLLNGCCAKLELRF